jgi:phosphatidylglycerol:prolipoprotein diacylglycerol transferase
MERRVSNAYPVIFSLGALAGLLWLALSGSPQPSLSEGTGAWPSPTSRVDAGLSALAAGLVGARAAFVIAHWSYYGGRPEQALMFWQGGLSWIGGALGALLGLGLYTALARRSFWPMADALAMPAAILALAAWVGCLLDGCAYGRRAQFGLLTPPSRDLLGTIASRWPAQTLGALYSVAVLVVLYWLGGQRIRSGALASICLALVSAGALALSFLRADPMGMLAGARLDAIGSGLLLLLALAGLWQRRFGKTSEGT